MSIPTWDQIKAQLNTKVIAVDFDDTITKHAPYPIQGELRKDARKYLHKLHDKGYRLVLWSARVGNSYEMAKTLCERWKLPIEFDSDELIHGSSGKLVASFYVDDKAILGKLKWRKVYRHIIKNV